MISGLKQIFIADFSYKKAGVTLVNIENINNPQNDLLISSNNKNKNINLMSAFDKINSSFGQNSISFGISANKKKQYVSSSHKSKNFTTSWQELPLVK